MSVTEISSMGTLDQNLLEESFVKNPTMSKVATMAENFFYGSACLIGATASAAIGFAVILLPPATLPYAAIAISIDDHGMNVTRALFSTFGVIVACSLANRIALPIIDLANALYKKADHYLGISILDPSVKSKLTAI